jgi:hypothetical protein
MRLRDRLVRATYARALIMRLVEYVDKGTPHRKHLAGEAFGPGPQCRDWIDGTRRAACRQTALAAPQAGCGAGWAGVGPGRVLAGLPGAPRARQDLSIEPKHG